MLRLYKNIKERRIELGLTQEDLAIKLGYSGKSMIAKIEAGLVDLPQSKIMLFAEALNVTPLSLMGWSDEENEVISKVRNALDQVPPREEISEHDRHILYCYHLLSDEMRENVDDILSKAYKKHIDAQKKANEENSAS